ncbi:MAG: 7-cyano-7-deazaguanine synthase QueC [Myxococcales bacterium]|nr:7-cyano-7-deazaguanine synthase QueC [Myxococcales bacterium]MCB9751779.1 7-cyano-7-deazaguanine synthase QueC [Myxococcales bacterium]
MTNAKPAVVLLSGGLDSSTTLAIAKEEGCAPYALTFRYGQRHEFELQAARRIASEIGVVEHIVVDLDLRKFGGSALTANLEVPKGRTEDAMTTGIPVTYVPARNTIFLSVALGWAEVLSASDIFIGVNAVDYSGYPDCRPEFIDAFSAMANLATRAGVEGGIPLAIHTPLLHLTKGQIIRHGLSLDVPYYLTSTCYDPDDRGRACGECDACILRLKGFEEAGVEDPVEYNTQVAGKRRLRGERQLEDLERQLSQ